MAKAFAAGDGVLAKVLGFPAWPVRVEGVADASLNKTRYNVFFYGTCETAVLDEEDLYRSCDVEDRLGRPLQLLGLKEALALVERLAPPPQPAGKYGDDGARWLGLAEREQLAEERAAGLRRRAQALQKREEEMQLSRTALMSAVPHIHWLPDEILERIFSFLSQDDVILKVVSVCRRWREVAGDRILRKDLVLKDETVPTRTALRLIQDAPKLESLTLKRSDTVKLLQTASDVCTDLRRLSVTYCLDSNTLTDSLRKLFSNCPHITDLSLDVDIAGGVQFWGEMCATLSGLRKFETRCCWFNSPELDILLHNCARIEELKVVWCQCNDEMVNKLVQCWGPSLRVLELDASELSVAGFAPLSACLQLKRLQLRKMDASGEALRHVTVLSQLEELDVSCSSNILLEDWQMFFSQSRSACRLRNISLSFRNSVGEKVLSALAATCPNLERLKLYWCKGVNSTAVTELLQGCPRLRYLDVHGAGSSVAQVLPELPYLAPQLLWLNLSFQRHMRLGEAVLNKLKVQMPDLKVE